MFNRSTLAALFAVTSVAAVACGGSDAEDLDTGAGAATSAIAECPASLVTSESAGEATFPCTDRPSDAFARSCKTSGGSVCKVRNAASECACNPKAASAGVPALPTCRVNAGTSSESAPFDNGRSCSALSCSGDQLKCQVPGATGCDCEAAAAPASPFPFCQTSTSDNGQAPARSFDCPAKSDNICASSNQVVCKETGGSEKCSCL